MTKTIAVSFSEYDTYGCVICGCEYCFNDSGISGGGTTSAKCGECGATFLVLSDGLDKSSMGFGSEGKETYYPIRVPHPRQGMETKHKFVLPDLRPDDGIGEFFSPRGLGYDLAGFVKSKEAGERIIHMFKALLNDDIKTWLDYRESEPTWIQVKVQKEDGINLSKLCELTFDGIITFDIIKESII